MSTSHTKDQNWGMALKGFPCLEEPLLPHNTSAQAADGEAPSLPVRGSLAYLKWRPAKLLQPCPTLSNPTDRGPPGSSDQGILQARTPEWTAMPSSRASSRPRGGTQDWLLLHWQAGSLLRAPPGKPRHLIYHPSGERLGHWDQRRGVPSSCYGPPCPLPLPTAPAVSHGWWTHVLRPHHLRLLHCFLQLQPRWARVLGSHRINSQRNGPWRATAPRGRHQ